MPDKLLAIEKEKFMQIIVLDDNYFNQGENSLESLILVVMSKKINIYAKEIEGIEMVNIKNISTSQPNCQYFLYRFLNSTAGQFISTCFIPNIHILTPTLILNYENGKVNSSFSTIYFPMNLRSIEIIPQKNINTTFVAGISEGPMKSVTGKLFFCDMGACVPLFMSSKQIYLLSFDSFSFTNGGFVILCINSKNLMVWSNLTEIPTEPIPANITIDIYPIINHKCTVLKIVNANQTNAQIILSSHEYYYYVDVDFAGSSVAIIDKFHRYSNCDNFDHLEPSFLRN